MLNQKKKKDKIWKILYITNSGYKGHLEAITLLSVAPKNATLKSRLDVTDCSEQEWSLDIEGKLYPCSCILLLTELKRQEAVLTQHLIPQSHLQTKAKTQESLESSIWQIFWTSWRTVSYQGYIIGNSTDVT